MSFDRLSVGDVSGDPILSGVDALALIRARLRERECRIERDRGDSFMAQCPSHPDRTPSLSVERGAQPHVQVVLYCHAGCETTAVLDALAIDNTALFVTRGRSRKENVTGERGDLTLVTTAGTAGNVPRLRELIEDFERGRLEPQPIRLGELPPHARGDHRRVADDMALLMGLRAADGEPEALPYALRFCCERMGWSTEQPTRPARVIRKLVTWGVVVEGEPLPRRPGSAYGTKTYLPPMLDADQSDNEDSEPSSATPDAAIRPEPPTPENHDADSGRVTWVKTGVSTGFYAWPDPRNDDIPF